MIFLNSISQLQYYNSNDQFPCYCELLAYPSDLTLQSTFPTYTNTSGYTVQVFIYSADGLTQYEEATSYFSFYVFPYNGLRFNLQLNSFSPAMCAYGCWILRVIISNGATNVFDKYTDRYCQAACCDVPRGITAIQENVGHRDNALGTSDVPAVIPVGECGQKLIRIRTYFDCYDAFSNEYYQIPGTVYSGSASFAFQKITNIAGRIVERERAITRDISYNCRLQRSESFTPYLLESIGWSKNAIFPTWKKHELENQFHAPHFFIGDFTTEKEYQFSGGSVVKRIVITGLCSEMYRLETTIQDCSIRQTFGCDDPCAIIGSLTFIIPPNYSGQGFYDENRQLIGYSIPDLIIWYSGQNGIVSVTDASSDYTDGYGAILVQSNGYIPTSFYFDAITNTNRVYGAINPTIEPIPCIQFNAGIITIEDNICEDVTPGIITMSNTPEVTATITGFGDWIEDPTESNIVISSGTARMNLKVHNGLRGKADPVLSIFTLTVSGTTDTLIDGRFLRNDAMRVTINRLDGTTDTYNNANYTVTDTTLVLNSPLTFTTGDVVTIELRNNLIINPPASVSVEDIIIPTSGTTLTWSSFADSDVVLLTYAGVDYNTANFTQAGDTVTTTFALVGGEIITATLNNPAIVNYLNNEPIAVISFAGRPSLPILVTNADNGMIPAGSQLRIDTNGIVTWFGRATSEDMTGLTIDIDNSYYKL